MENEKLVYETINIIECCIDDILSHSSYFELYNTEYANKVFDTNRILKPRPSLEVNNIAFVDSDKKMRLKTGRYLVRKLKLDSICSAIDIEKIANSINTNLFGGEFKLLNGSDITEAYRQGIGNHSCMTGDCCEYTRLYEQNPDRYQLLVFKCGRISARGIVAKLDNGQYFLDRIYCNANIAFQKILDYAKNNEWLTRENDYQKTDLFISGLHYQNGCVPYMDTFKRAKINDNDNLLYLASPHSGDSRKYPLYLENTNGYIDNCDICCCCGEPVCDDNYMIAPDNGDTYCEYCFYQNYRCCELCDEYYYVDNTTYLNNYGYNVCNCCLENRFIQCIECNDYIRVHDGINQIRNTSGDYVCDDCVSENPKIYITCGDCGDIFYDENIMFCDEFQEYICGDCLANNYECCDYCGSLLRKNDNCDCLLSKQSTTENVEVI